MKKSSPLFRRENHRAPDLLLRIACADAYTAAGEFLSPSVESEQALLEMLKTVDEEKGYLLHPRTNHPKRTQYTDDTEMSIANAYVLLGKYPRTLEGFAQSYIDEHVRDGYRQGYARRFQEFMGQVRDGREFMRTIHRMGSCKNGAVMRAPIIGLLPDLHEVLRVATMQASVTHFTPCGLVSSRIAAQAMWYMLRSSVTPQDLIQVLRTHEEEILDIPQREMVLCEHWGTLQETWWRSWDGGPVVGRAYESIAMTTTRAALTLAATKASFVDLLRGAIEYGGDTDSVAAVAAAIMAPRSREPLPDFFERDLEFGSPKTGAERLRALSTELMDRFTPV